MMAVTVLVSAQSGTNSPYSQFGLGVQGDQTSGFNRGMNGLGLAFREGNEVNFINPASYSAVDSFTFVFDVGMTGQITNFSENGVKKNAKNADFEYAVASFRLRRHVGMSFGILPLTNVGYNYSSSGKLNSIGSTIYQNSFNGSGGLHQVYVGAGWEPFRGFSVGANVGYVWGEINRNIENAYYSNQSGTISVDGNINSLTKKYTASASSLRLNFGAQYEKKLGKESEFVVGATFSPSHSLGADSKCTVTSTNSSSGVTQSTDFTIEDALKMPAMFGGGVMYSHHGKLKMGVDYRLQQWSGVSFPEYQVNNNIASYVLNKDYFMDRHQVTIGGEYCKGATMRGFFNRMRYRVGASYATPYYKINGHDGPKEISVSAGFGIPIVNGYIIRSGWANIPVLNISGQWVHQSAGNGMLTENTFRINLGITFNERWFAKWKVD